MRSIAAGNFKDSCLQILDEVATHRRWVVNTKRGRPVAKLVPVTPAGKPQSLARSIVSESGNPFGTGELWDAGGTKVRKPRSTRQMMVAPMIPMIVVCWSCSDMPVAHPTTPTPTSTATQQSTLAPVLSAQIAPSIEKIRVGETLTFSMTLELGEGVPPSGPMPFWSSTNRAVILIDATGKATGVGEGSAMIEVSAHGTKVSRNIQVTSSSDHLFRR